jgi:Na+/H+-dicarboxylate symporter
MDFMSKQKSGFAKNYGFLCIMLSAIILGCALGAFWPGATVLEPLGTVFINLMFCVVVPLVFASISSAIANMGSRRRAGKIVGTTIATFVVTGAVAAIIMIVLMKLYPPVLVPWDGLKLTEGEIGEHASVAQLIVNFFTVEDFASLLSRKAMLPLIVFSMLFGFAVSLNGGRQTPVGRFLEDLTNVMMRIVKLITYYAPIAFFGFFASLVATYGPKLIGDYGRAMLVYYPLCLVYIFTAFPLFAWFGGGRGAVGVMFRHILKPAATSLGTCSSVATIPTNIEVAQETGISKDVSDIVLPLGATMHMDGSCFSCVLKIAFMFGVFGIPFEGIGTFIKIVLVAVFSSVAMSGIPGGGYIGEYVICSIFFPDQMALAYPIIITIGNLVDPPATMINSAGDYVVSFIVSRFVDGKDWLQKRLHPSTDAE